MTVAEILTGVQPGEQVVTGVTGSDTGATDTEQQGGPPGGAVFVPGGGGRR